MIPLDSGEWFRLRHAYGAAANVPILLRQLAMDAKPKSDYRQEPWFSLWSSLCHQGDVYDASYAAVPHIVRIGIDTPGPIDIGFFSLPACIEVARNKGRGPELSEQLAKPYGDALHLLHECAFRHAQDDWSDDMAMSVAAALAVAKSRYKLAEALTNLDDEMVAKIIALDI